MQLITRLLRRPVNNGGYWWGWYYLRRDNRIWRHIWNGVEVEIKGSITGGVLFADKVKLRKNPAISLLDTIFSRTGMRDESFTARENRSQFTEIGRALD